MNAYIIHNGELYHYGVKGMKWGIRRAVKTMTRGGKRIVKNAVSSTKSRIKTMRQKDATPDQQAIRDRRKKALKVGVAAAGAVLALYGAKKVHAFLDNYDRERHARIIAQIQRNHDLSYQRYWMRQNGYLK